MTYTPPTWLNSEFLERALKSNGSRPNLTVICCDVDRATKPGDNFGSEMYRATLRIKENGDTEDTSVIIKSILRGGDAALEIEVMEAFIREAKIYSDINVLMLKEAFLEEYQPFAAKCFYTSPEPSQGAIVLEDLKRGGFRLANISLGLDLKHCLLVIKTIARFHASSLILLQKDPNRFESFMEHHFVKHSHGGMATFLRVSVEKLLNEVNKWAGYGKYVDALKSLMDTPMTRWVDALRRDDTGFRVLTHGDLWLNNIMFSYSEESGEVQQVRFVDFQLSSVASPAIDLLYFMNTSVCPDVLENDFQTLVDEYYNALCVTLSKLGYKNLRPTKELLNSELNKRGLYGALAGFSVRSVALCDRDHVLDIQSTESYEGSVYLSNAYKTVIRRLLPLYEKWGWLKV